MDWHMDPVFRSIFRQAEQTDARLGIRRDEKHEDGRKKEHEEKEPSAEGGFDEGRPTVSVAALIAFLEGLVQTLRMKALPLPTPDYVVPVILPPQDKGSSLPQGGYGSAPAHAASAYRNVAEGKNLRQDGADSSSSASFVTAGQAETLSAEDVRAIHNLLESLKTLRVETLTIEKAPTFLQSLSNAVERAKEAEG